MKTVIRSSMIGIVLMLLIPTFLQARIWTSSGGNYTVEAELVGYKDGVAQLKKTDGSVVSVRKEQLSQEDWDFLEAGIATNEALTVIPVTLPLGATIETHAISVRKKLPASEREAGVFMLFFGQSEGTVVSLLVQVPDYSIVALDEEASRISKFVDDKDTDLLQVVPKTNEAPRGMLVPMTVTKELIDEDQISLIPETDENMEGMIGDMMISMMENMFTYSPSLFQVQTTPEKWILIDCRAPNCPASGTQTITLEGQLVLRCGQGTKTTEHKNIPLDENGKIEINGVSVAVEKVKEGGVSLFGGMGERQMQISLTSTQPLDTVIRYMFLDAEGNEIEWRESGSFSSSGHSQRFFHLAEEVDSVTIQLEEYEKMETVALPLSLKVGLGL